MHRGQSALYVYVCVFIIILARDKHDKNPDDHALQVMTIQAHAPVGLEWLMRANIYFLCQYFDLNGPNVVGGQQ